MFNVEQINWEDFLYTANIILEKKQNILDITEILWQNILVEIPSKVRSTDEDINLEDTQELTIVSDDSYFNEVDNNE